MSWTQLLVVFCALYPLVARSEPEFQARTNPADRTAIPFEVQMDSLRARLTRGEFEAAESQARQLLQSVESNQGSMSGQSADVLDLLVEWRGRAGLSTQPDTRSLAECAVRRREQLPEDDPLALARRLTNLGSVLQDSGDSPAARPCFERALALREAVLGPDHLECVRRPMANTDSDPS